MLEAYNVLNLMFAAGTLLTHITLTLINDTQWPALGEMAQVQLYEQKFSIRDPLNIGGPRGCIYSGVLIPVERTWEVVQSGLIQDVVHPPAPGKAGGYAVIISKKRCPGQEDTPEFLINAGEFTAVPRVGAYYEKGARDTFNPVAGMAPEHRPKWFIPAMTSLVKLAETNPVAKQALEDVQAAHPVAKQVLEDVRAAQGAPAHVAPAQGTPVQEEKRVAGQAPA